MTTKLRDWSCGLAYCLSGYSVDGNLDVSKYEMFSMALCQHSWICRGIWCCSAWHFANLAGYAEMGICCCSAWHFAKSSWICNCSEWHFARMGIWCCSEWKALPEALDQLRLAGLVVVAQLLPSVARVLIVPVEAIPKSSGGVVNVERFYHVSEWDLQLFQKWHC